ncbi:glycosyltransferase family 39 protein [Candidatus Curtissbacteria bacterium]|nr:glycosyltransferase family 39 protein [Candidatus Curtissbacteria bacterium]
MKRFQLIFVLALLVAAFAVRLYKIDRPIADWHSWRQADTAAVSRNFIKEGYTPFVPKYDDMSSQTNGKDNPNRYRFVEFPIYNSIVAFVWYFTGIKDIYARLTTAIITVISTLFLYLIVSRYSGRKTALLSAFFFAFIPYNIFYSTTVLPGPTMVFFLLLSYFTFQKWLDKQKVIWLLICSIATSAAILTWPIALIFTFPIVYLAFEKYHFSIFKKPYLWAFAIVSIVPFLAWRLWMINYPAGIPNWQFLINEGNIRFKGAFFQWIFAERLGNLILTFGGVPLFILGLIRKPGREKLFYFSILFSSLAYVVIFASGNVRHDYYQIPIIPSLAIFLAIGTKTLFTLPKETFNRYIGPVIALILICFIFAFGYYQIRGYYWINKPEIVKAGKAVDRLLPKDAIVIAPYNGDTAFLYQTNRHGYPIVDRPLEKFIDDGTKYLVSVDVGDAGIQNLAKHCKVIDQTKEYLIVEMFKDCIGK